MCDVLVVTERNPKLRRRIIGMLERSGYVRATAAEAYGREVCEVRLRSPRMRKRWLRWGTLTDFYPRMISAEVFVAGPEAQADG